MAADAATLGRMARFEGGVDMRSLEISRLTAAYLAAQLRSLAAHLVGPAEAADDAAPSSP